MRHVITQCALSASPRTSAKPQCFGSRGISFAATGMTVGRELAAYHVCHLIPNGSGGYRALQNALKLLRSSTKVALMFQTQVSIPSLLRCFCAGKLEVPPCTAAQSHTRPTLASSLRPCLGGILDNYPRGAGLAGHAERQQSGLHDVLGRDHFLRVQPVEHAPAEQPLTASPSRADGMQH